jgi:hypothetical protein
MWGISPDFTLSTSAEQKREYGSVTFPSPVSKSDSKQVKAKLRLAVRVPL